MNVFEIASILNIPVKEEEKEPNADQTDLIMRVLDGIEHQRARAMERGEKEEWIRENRDLIDWYNRVSLVDLE